jgi:hypothetical protein
MPDYQDKTVPAIIRDLSAIAEQVGIVIKATYSDDLKYHFRTREAMVDACRAAMNDRSVTIAPAHVVELSRERFTRTNKRGYETTQINVAIMVTWEFMSGVDGSTYRVMVPGEAADYGDKATSKAMTMSEKQAYEKTLRLASGEPDPDGQDMEDHPDQRLPAADPFDTADKGVAEDAGHVAALAEKIKAAQTREELVSLRRTILAAHEIGQITRQTLSTLLSQTESQGEWIGLPMPTKR